MIFKSPKVRGQLREELEALQQLRSRLGSETSSSQWMGSLRREVRAASIEGSTSIEGFSVDPAEAVSLTSGAKEPEATDANQLAVSSYARAMDHVGSMAKDPFFRWSDRVILDLHFDACYFQRDKDPGLWREGEIVVTSSSRGVEYQGPPAEQIPALIAEMVEWLNGDETGDAIVRGAMAHLNLVSVHPFRDGNGRVSRIVQSLVLARDGLVSPEFSSIEEYLGTHTAEYYAALRDVQGGSYQPTRDATGWVAFCVNAHIVQARQRLAQIEEAARRWTRLEELTAARGWPERLVIALEQSLMGGSDRATYSAEAEISPASASNDFRRLLDSGLIEQRGRGRSTRYLATGELKAKL